MRKLAMLAAAAAIGASTSALATDFGPDFDRLDFGEQVEILARAQALKLFGTFGTLRASSSESITADAANADPTALVRLAPGLRARVVSSAATLGANIDMMALWPNDFAPTHIIACNEQGPTQAAVQRIDLGTGTPTTILTGMTSCDPTHRTPWGTIVVGEEVGGTGHVLEIIDPLHTTGVLFDRVGETLSGADAGNVALRLSLGRLAFEGIGILPNGVAYYGDENRPQNGSGGGAYFKFIPDNLWAGGPPITNLSASPLVSGRVFGMRLGKRANNTDFGQGNQSGRGVWVEVIEGAPAGVTRLDLRASAPLLKLTTYYRPEDIAIDLKALKLGNVRMCGNNTGEDGVSKDYGETFCLTDATVTDAASTGALSTPEYQVLVLGDSDFGMMDNITYQPGRGNWIVHEDGEGADATPPRNNDLFSCVDDGMDRDHLADVCAKIGTLNDLNAEWTGGVFDRTGRRFFVSVQHNVTGHGVVLEITGWR